MKQILTEPEDMNEFIKLIENQIQGATNQRDNLQSQLDNINRAINEMTNTLELCKDWLDIMSGDKMSLIRMAYEDIKKNMKDVVVIEDTDEEK